MCHLSLLRWHMSARARGTHISAFGSNRGYDDPQRWRCLTGRRYQKSPFGGSAIGHKATFRFCPACGSTVAYQNEGAEDLIAVPVGLFEGALAVPPMFSYFEHRKLAWASVSVASEGQRLA